MNSALNFFTLNTTQFILFFFDLYVSDYVHFGKHSKKFLKLLFGQINLLFVLSLSIKLNHFDVFLFHSQENFKLFWFLHRLFMSLVRGFALLNESFLNFVNFLGTLVNSFSQFINLCRNSCNSFINKVECFLIRFLSVMKVNHFQYVFIWLEDFLCLFKLKGFLYALFGLCSFFKWTSFVKDQDLSLS